MNRGRISRGGSGAREGSVILSGTRSTVLGEWGGGREWEGENGKGEGRWEGIGEGLVTLSRTSIAN